MLPVLVAGAAACAAIFGQLFSTISSADSAIENVFRNNSKFSSSVPPTLLVDNCTPEQQPQLDKQVDAFFVSHGVGEETQADVASQTQDTKPNKEIIQISSIKQLSWEGINWLILSYVPWCPHSAELLEHFNSVYSQVKSKNVQLAVVNIEEHPELVYQLQLSQLPALTLITEDSRIRAWPFTGHRMNPEILAFLEHSQWRYIPVYQKLNTAQPHQFHIQQVRLYLRILKYLTSLQPQIFNFIQMNRQTVGLSLAFLLSSPVLAFKKLLQ